MKVSNKILKSAREQAKVEGFSIIKDLKPINLVWCSYKLTAKALARRLTKVVGKCQDAFVRERQIMRSTLIVNEAVHSLLNKSVDGILCKLDMEKTYDHMAWNFLFYILNKNGL